MIYTGISYHDNHHIPRERVEVMYKKHSSTLPLPFSQTLRVPIIGIATSAAALAARGPGPSNPTALAILGRAIGGIGGLRPRARGRCRGAGGRWGRGARVAAAGDGRVEERPRLAGRKLDTIRTCGIRDVAASVGDPGHGCPGAGVCRLDVALLPGRGLGRVLRGAAVGLQPLVAQLPAQADGQDVVGRAVDPEVGDRRGAARAAGELGAGDD
jgi:hypothetical protein